MNKKLPLVLFLSVLSTAAPARAADESCWKSAEVTAYNITMQTLMIAHVAAACDSVVPSTPSLKTRFSDFITKNGPAMESDRGHLSDYFKRAYGDDYQTPMQKSLDRENTRIEAKVAQNVSAQSCAGGAQLINALAAATWPDFVQDADGQRWADKAGLPACQ